MSKLLSILIPTYNRCVDLEKNLNLLEDLISKINIFKDIEIIISNNKSNDNTINVVEQFINKSSVDIQFYNQDENIGLEKNALYVLEKSSSEYIMYLGDDDFINKEYLFEVVEKIKYRKDISCIIPSFHNVLPNGKIHSSRDIEFENKFYVKGINNCIQNSWRGHQLSGVVHLRENLLESYHNNNVSNIYLFIYFVAYNCIRGTTYHFTSCPIHISHISQDKKDWDYGKDGLLNEIFDNYNKLDVSYFVKLKLQLKQLKVQKQRYMKDNIFESTKIVLNIINNKNTFIIVKLLFPSLFIYYFLRQKISKIRHIG